MTLKVAPAQKPQFALIWADEGKMFHFDRNFLRLAGFPDGNVYHVQRSHREKRLSLRLGHHEHDAEQVSAQELELTDTDRYRHFSMLRSVVA